MFYVLYTFDFEKKSFEMNKVTLTDLSFEIKRILNELNSGESKIGTFIVKKTRLFIDNSALLNSIMES